MKKLFALCIACLSAVGSVVFASDVLTFKVSASDYQRGAQPSKQTEQGQIDITKAGLNYITCAINEPTAWIKPDCQSIQIYYTMPSGSKNWGSLFTHCETGPFPTKNVTSRNLILSIQNPPFSTQISSVATIIDAKTMPIDASVTCSVQSNPGL